MKLKSIVIILLVITLLTVIYSTIGIVFNYNNLYEVCIFGFCTFITAYLIDNELQKNNMNNEEMLKPQGESKPLSERIDLLTINILENYVKQFESKIKEIEKSEAAYGPSSYLGGVKDGLDYAVRQLNHDIECIKAKTK